MKKLACLVVLWVAVSPSLARANGWRKHNSELVILNHMLKGKVIDQTANHGKDLRIWSRSLGQRRDLYVYLPPNFDPRQRYPVVIFLHGHTQDEQAFLEVFRWIDKAISECELPPFIAAAPDGTITGEPDGHKPGTFFLNSNLGDFEDFVINDVWDFLIAHYPIRPEREAHALAGMSMGGFAAFNLGIRYRGAFGIAIGIHPPLNLRWMDNEGNYRANFDPSKWGWRTSFNHPHELAGKFAGLIPVRVRPFIEPLYGSGDSALLQISCNNPIELVDRTCLRDGQLQMYVAYGCKDELNIDAQAESFLYLTAFRGIRVGRGYDPSGRHDMKTVCRLFPGLVEWLAPRLAPFSPGGARFLQLCQRPVIALPNPPAMEQAYVAKTEAAQPTRQPILRWMDREQEPAPPRPAVPATRPVPAAAIPATPLPAPPAASTLFKDKAPLVDRKDLGPFAGPPVEGSPFTTPTPANPPLPAAPTPAPPAAGQDNSRRDILPMR